MASDLSDLFGNPTNNELAVVTRDDSYRVAVGSFRPDTTGGKRFLTLKLPPVGKVCDVLIKLTIYGPQNMVKVDVRGELTNTPAAGASWYRNCVFSDNLSYKLKSGYDGLNPVLYLGSWYGTNSISDTQFLVTVEEIVYFGYSLKDDQLPTGDVTLGASTTDPLPNNPYMLVRERNTCGAWGKHNLTSPGFGEIAGRGQEYMLLTPVTASNENKANMTCAMGRLMALRGSLTSGNSMTILDIAASNAYNATQVRVKCLSSSGRFLSIDKVRCKGVEWYAMRCALSGGQFKHFCTFDGVITSAIEGTAPLEVYSAEVDDIELVQLNVYDIVRIADDEEANILTNGNIGGFYPKE